MLHYIVEILVYHPLEPLLPDLVSTDILDKTLNLLIDMLLRLLELRSTEISLAKFSEIAEFLFVHMGILHSQVRKGLIPVAYYTLERRNCLLCSGELIPQTCSLFQQFVEMLFLDKPGLL